MAVQTRVHRTRYGKDVMPYSIPPGCCPIIHISLPRPAVAAGRAAGARAGTIPSPGSCASQRLRACATSTLYSVHTSTNTYSRAISSGILAGVGRVCGRWRLLPSAAEIKYRWSPFSSVGKAQAWCRKRRTAHAIARKDCCRGGAGHSVGASSPSVDGIMGRPPAISNHRLTSSMRRCPGRRVLSTWVSGAIEPPGATPSNIFFRHLSLAPLPATNCGGAGNCRGVSVTALPSGSGVVLSGGGSGGKVRRVFLCSKCGARHGQYHGKCSRCGGFGTMDREGIVEEHPAAAAGGGGGGRAAGVSGGGGAGVQALEAVQRESAAAAILARGSRHAEHGDMEAAGAGDDMATTAASSGRRVGWVANGGGADGPDDAPMSLRVLSQLAAERLGRGHDGRIQLSGRTGAEVQMVLGGGVVPGALVLIGGDPGVGKSTMTLQIAAMMAHPEINFDELEEQIQFDGEDDGEAADDCQEWRAGGKQARDEFGLSPSYGNEFGSDGVVPDARQGTAFAPAINERELPQLEQFTTADVHHDMYGIDMDVDTANASEQREGEFRMPLILEPCRTVLYVSAEETREQVVARSRRMGLDCCDRVIVFCRSEMSAISRAVLDLRPDAMVMDSINTVYLNSLPQAPGTVTQIRECGQLLLRLAKDHRVAVFIIGHVTKGGEMAGPNMLAHMVDTVLYLEGDVAQSVRLLRVVKNRHGSDAECGVFSMDPTGLHAVANHSALFLESRTADSEGGEDSGASSVAGITLQGSRAILVEVQALVCPMGDRAAAAASVLSYRSATGFDKQRLANLCAILDKHVPTLELSACSVIVNVVGGTQVRDVATDLALAVAIASSYYNVLVPRDLAVCGEVDLAGRVRRSFQRLDVRVREAAKLGFKRVVIPQSQGWERLAADPHLISSGVEVVAVRNVEEALRVSLGAHVCDHRPAHMKPPSRGKPAFGAGPPGSRFSRKQLRPDMEAMEPQMGIASDGSWPRAAVVGGVVAAYAAAAAALPPPHFIPADRYVPSQWRSAEEANTVYGNDNSNILYADGGGEHLTEGLSGNAYDGNAGWAAAAGWPGS